MRHWYLLTHHQWSLLRKHQRMLHQIQPCWHVPDKSFYGKPDQTVNYTVSNCYIIYQLCISKLGIFYFGFLFSTKYWCINIASHYVIKLLVLLIHSLSTRVHHRSLAWFVHSLSTRVHHRSLAWFVHSLSWKIESIIHFATQIFLAIVLHWP